MNKTCVLLLALSCTGTIALAGDTGSSAAARRGSSQATAWFQGKNGFAQTQSRSGWVDYARGTAVSWTKGSLNVSTSYAVHSPHGQSVAGSLQIAANRKGATVSSSRVVSQGRNSSAAAGGRTAGHRAATSFASGKTGPHGRVAAESFSRSIDYRDRFRHMAAHHLRHR